MLPENLQIHHIAQTMKLSELEVVELAENPRKGFMPPKRLPVGGKTRLITAPKRKYKMPYAWLGTFVRKEFPLHPAAHGSVPRRSPFTAAARHLGLRHLLCRDVKDAFPSVKADRFYLEMLALGFNSDMARLLTKLLLPDGDVPQGGPASNAAIDLFFYRIDCDVERELSVLAARYTRFTDGLDASFESAERAKAAAGIIETNLNRLGLSINTKKLDKNGWQPADSERLVCGVCVNSPLGTALARATVIRLISECEGLYRGARAIASHTIAGLARRRRSLQGWVNQTSQADLAPVGDLRRRLRQVDDQVLLALRKQSIYPNRQWYTKGSHFDQARELSGIWSERRKFAMALAG